METNKAILARRSVRKYVPDPIDDKVLQQVLEAARQAPSWANTQCWRLVVAKDKEIRNKLADAMFTLGGKISAAAEAMNVAPVVVAFCAETGKSGFTFKEPREVATDKGEYWYMFDTALAMENFCLSACAAGLGTVILGAFDAKKATSVLKVPAGFVVVALTPLGYPDETPEPRPRRPMSEMVSYDKFGGK